MDIFSYFFLKSTPHLNYQFKAVIIINNLILYYLIIYYYKILYKDIYSFIN